MKNSKRVIVLIAFTLSILTGLFAQARTELTPDQLRAAIQTERERYIGVIVEMTETLPQLYRQDPARAAQTVEAVSAMLDRQLSFSLEYRPFSPKEVAYLKGHLRAYEQSPENLYSYYRNLIESSRITDDQPSMHYLMYLMQMQGATGNSRSVANQLLNSLLNNAAQDRANFLYNLLWIDNVAAAGDTAAVAQKLAAFQTTRNLISGQIIPRKEEIAQRVRTVAANPFFTAPTVEQARVLSALVEQIKTDLASVYTDLLPLEGLIGTEELTANRNREMALLDSLKQNIDGYLNNENWVNERRDASRRILGSLEESHGYFSDLVQKIDRVFANVERSYGEEYAFYLDLETKILLDLVGASVIYAHAVELIDIELSYTRDMSPDQRSFLLTRRDTFWNESVRLLAQYDEYYARFTADNVWKTHYDTVIDSYIDALRQQITLETGMNEVGYALQNLERRRMLAVGLPVDLSISNLSITQASEVFDAHYSYLTLQRDFRLLQYRDQRRLSNLSSISYDENVALLDAINRDKQDYIMRAQRFVRDYPDFEGFMQPTGEFLVSNADIYYNMAEFQYSLDPNNPSAALALYRRVRDLKPGYTMADRVNYNIGFLEMNIAINTMDGWRSNYFASNPNAVTYSDALKFQENHFRDAITAFRNVIEMNGEQGLKDESHLHLASMYFLLASDSSTPETYYNLALSYLNPLVDDANNSRHYEALYQRGVIHMNYGGNAGYRNAINDYANLLMGIKTGVITDPALIQDYQDAAVENIAFALIALDGEDFESTAQGAELEAFLVDYEDETVLARIFDRAATQKNQELNSPLQARDFLMAKIRRMPRTLDNPTGIQQTVLLYNQFFQELPADRQRLVMSPLTYRFNQYQYLIDNYNQNSAWYQANRNNPAIATQLAVIDTAFATMERRLINNFSQAVNDANLTQEAKKASFVAYQEHIAKWAAFEAVHAGNLASRQIVWQDRITNFSAVLAESSTSPQDWFGAYTHLTRYNDQNPAQAQFRYEGLAFRFAQSLLDDQVPKFADSGYRAEEGLPANLDALYSFYENAALRFIAQAISPANVNAQNQTLAFTTLMSLGDINAQRGRYNQAEIYYLRLLGQDTTTAPMKRDLYLKLADLSSTQAQYANAENYYRQALVLAVNAEDTALIQNQVVLQIQNKLDAAEAAGDYQTVAQDYLRLAAEFKISNPQRYIGFQNSAQDAYIRAGQVQNAIDILVQMASERTEKDEVYALHYKAWGLADSLMQDSAQSQRLKDSFITRFPNSNEAFRLHLMAIDALKANPSTRSMAAEKYLELYGRARARTIDTGEYTAQEIYRWAISIYITDNLIAERNRHFESYIQAFPTDSNSLVYMQGLADHYWAAGDTLAYEGYAREIFRRDRTNSAYYQRLADARLGRVAAEFDAAYLNKNWTVVFAKKDEFVRMENAYKREGLTFNTQSAYEAFARAQTEYDRIQAKAAFYRRYDTQLSTFERSGFISRTPSDLITFNPNTTWRNHLFGGRPNRVPNLENAVTAEVNRVLALLSSNREFELDNARVLRAWDLIARINEHAKYAIDTQVERYFTNSNEFAPYRSRRGMSQEEYDNLVSNMRAFAAQYTTDYRNAAYSMYLQAYNQYYLAGYNDRYTARAQQKLAEWAVEPQYNLDQYPLGTDWTISLESGARLNLITTVNSPNNVSLGKISIPANDTLIMSREITARTQPDIAFIQMVYPYDASFSLNGRELTPVYVAADTLTAGVAMTTRYALRIDQSSWVEGANALLFRFPNESAQAVDLYLNLQVYTDRARLAAAVPTETVKLVSNPRWIASTFDATSGEQTAASSIAASSFGIDKAKILDLESTTAEAIWVNETDSRKDNLIFETSFDITTIFREGYIDMIAPQTATVYLNGVEIAQAEEFYYESEPLVYYPNRIVIDSQHVVNGRNTLRFVVNNNTDFRGFLAEVTIKKTIQE